MKPRPEHFGHAVGLISPASILIDRVTSIPSAVGARSQARTAAKREVPSPDARGALSRSRRARATDPGSGAEAQTPLFTIRGTEEGIWHSWFPTRAPARRGM